MSQETLKKEIREAEIINRVRELCREKEDIKPKPPETPLKPELQELWKLH